MIRRALLAVGAGVPLVLLAFLLVVVFRSVILAPEMPRPGGTYTEGMVGPVGAVNPLLPAEDPNAHDVDALLFEPLLRVAPSGDVEALLASRWEVSPDLRSYTFTLRPNARWSDGSAVLPEDVVFTVRTIQDPQYPGVVLNASWKDIIVTAIDASRVRFALPGRNAGFPAILGQLEIMPAHLLAGKPMADIVSSSTSTRPVGSGPFRLARRLPDRVLLERNPFAWRKPWLDKVVVRSFPTADAALTALEQRQLDGVANLSAAGTERVRHVARLAVHAAATYQYAELLFNLKPEVPYFQDRRVRQAIAMAIDKDAIIRDVLAGQGHLADGPIPRAITWAYNTTVRPPGHDPTAAAQLLDQAGWTLEDGVRKRAGVALQFQLAVSSDLSPYPAVAGRIARDLAGLGIEAQVSPVSTATLIHDFLNPRSFALALTAFDNGPDPDVFAFWHSSQTHPGGFNFVSMKRNVFVDKDLEDGRSSVTLTTRAKAYYDLQELFAQEVPAVYLYSPTFAFAADRRIRGVHLDSAVEPNGRYTHVQDWFIEVGR